MAESDYVFVDGIDYSPAGIEELRQIVIGWRNESMNQWPEAIDFTVASSHVIALLDYMRFLVENNVSSSASNSG